MIELDNQVNIKENILFTMECKFYFNEVNDQEHKLPDSSHKNVRLCQTNGLLMYGNGGIMWRIKRIFLFISWKMEKPE